MNIYKYFSVLMEYVKTKYSIRNRMTCYFLCAVLCMMENEITLAE